MFVVVSKWEALSGQWDAFEAVGHKMMALIRSWSEVEVFYNVRTGPESILSIIGYRSQADYERLVKDPNGPFEQASRETDIESVGKWIWSERGETFD